MKEKRRANKEAIIRLKNSLVKLVYLFQAIIRRCWIKAIEKIRLRIPYLIRMYLCFIKNEQENQRISIKFFKYLFIKLS